MREQVPFLLSGPNLYFAPFFAPDRISNGKERNLSREGNFCGGEDVTDLGAKNRSIHITGRIRKCEIPSFDAVVDSNDPFASKAASGKARPAGNHRAKKSSFSTVSTL